MVGLLMYADIQKLKVLGYKKQRAARQLSIDTKTVRKYWNMAEDEYIAYSLETKERTKIMDPFHNFVLDRITAYPEITSAIIYDNLRAEFTNFSPSYRSVRLFVCNLREKEGIPSALKVRQYGENPELPFGFQAQVDMGQKIMKDTNGKQVKVYVFAMVLSASRQKYVICQIEPFTAQTFVMAHDKAFRYFGGRPVEIVYDQDRVMVVSENGGDIIFTQTFENYKNYAGFSVHLCRGADPESKGKIEAVVKYVKNNFLSCRIFHGIASLNSDALAWLDRTGNGLVHETTKMIPSVVFVEEQKHLKPVPEFAEPMIIPKIALVRKNNMVMYRQNRYTMPRATSREDFIFYLEQLGYKVDWHDNKKYITFTMPNGKKCRNKKLYPPEKFTKEALVKTFAKNRETQDTMKSKQSMEMLIKMVDLLRQQNDSNTLPLISLINGELEGGALKEFLYNYDADSSLYNDNLKGYLAAEDEWER